MQLLVAASLSGFIVDELDNNISILCSLNFIIPPKSSISFIFLVLTNLKAFWWLVATNKQNHRYGVYIIYEFHHAKG